MGVKEEDDQREDGLDCGKDDMVKKWVFMLL